MNEFNEYETAARRKYENISSVSVSGLRAFFDSLRNLEPSTEDLNEATRRSGAKKYKDTAPYSPTKGEDRIDVADVIKIAQALDKIVQDRLTAAAARNDAERQKRYELEDRRGQREAQLRDAEARRAAALDNMIDAHLAAGARR